MDNPSGGRDGRYASLGYNMGMIGSDTGAEIYGRPSTSQLAAAAAAAAASQIGRGGGGATMMSAAGAATPGVGSIQRGIKRTTSDVCYGDDGNNPAARQQSLSQSMSAAGGMPGDCVPDNLDESFTSLSQPKKSPPSNGKKTKGRVKIKMEYIDNKLRRYTTFSKRKTGIMKKAYELSTLTGTQVMLLVASETGHVYTFATRKLQPMITSEAGKALIQTCLNSPDPPPSGSSGDQRMSATGFEETELTYNIADDEQKVRQLVYGSPHGGSLHAGYPGTGPGSGPAGGPTAGAHPPPPPPPPPPGSQHAPPSHAQHAHLIAHAHAAASPSSHLVPCSSPGPMLAGGPYQQSCPSPLPPHHAAYHPHMSHSHPQR
ncbi:serum response factor isoform X2 [Monomorium pharaonis]|uniref:serum response factor isoform X2 n=1 Tax=Monomorium pharaonis TaxID=307658 RepID=UPI001747B08C|nr:serum response factor isoform X2 [Monomorium pharaonis]